MEFIIIAMHKALKCLELDSFKLQQSHTVSIIVLLNEIMVKSTLIFALRNILLIFINAVFNNKRLVIVGYIGGT